MLKTRWDRRHLVATWTVTNMCFPLLSLNQSVWRQRINLHDVDILERRCIFRDEDEAEIRDQFLPWLSSDVTCDVSVKLLIDEIRSQSVQKTVEIEAALSARCQKSWTEADVEEFRQNQGIV
jgi:hypothetical protein